MSLSNKQKDQLAAFAKKPVETKVEFAFEGGRDSTLTLFGHDFEHCKLKFIDMGTDCVYVVKGVWKWIVDADGVQGWVKS